MKSATYLVFPLIFNTFAMMRIVGKSCIRWKVPVPDFHAKNALRRCSIHEIRSCHKRKPLARWQVYTGHFALELND
jgi:hypothetical protein